MVTIYNFNQSDIDKFKKFEEEFGDYLENPEVSKKMIKFLSERFEDCIPAHVDVEDDFISYRINSNKLNKE
jgi:hemerythrin-like domain-containing protein